MALLEAELGQPPQNLFSEITPEPVAAASLGQVCSIPYYCCCSGGHVMRVLSNL